MGTVPFFALFEIVARAKKGTVPIFPGHCPQIPLSPNSKSAACARLRENNEKIRQIGGNIMQVESARIAMSIGVACLIGFSATLRAQEAHPDFEGLWSDPPQTLADSACFFFCSDLKIDRLFELLDDPANDERPIRELAAEAVRYEIEQLIEPLLTEQALATYPIDPADDPGFLNCEPWGIAKQMFAPHQLEITQHDDRVVFRYGEWNAYRTIFLDGRERPARAPKSLLGYSVGRYEGDTLVVETTGIRSNITLWWAEHSDQLELVERYRRDVEGNRLLLEVTLTDPLSMSAPLTLQKVWDWTPEQDISDYDQCEPPTDFIRGTNEQFG